MRVLRSSSGSTPAAEIRSASSARCVVSRASMRSAYACLVAIMAQGLGYHRDSEKRLGAAAFAESGLETSVVSSAGALVEALHHLGAKRVAVLAPYMKPLTATVCEYIQAEGVEVVDSISLEVPDNLAVGRLDPTQLIGLSQRVDTANADALVLSACVQMPSLPVLDAVQQRFDIPLVSAASATVWQTLRRLGLDPVAPRAGALLAG